MMRMPGGAKVPRQWGKPRPLHQYLHRYWDASRQDWHYVYPKPPEGVGGGSPESDDHETVRAHVAGEENQWRQQEQMAQDVDARARDGAMAEPPESREPQADNDEKKAYLEGFEEGYDLGKRVEAKEGE
jgi:hypothetical protein